MLEYTEYTKFLIALLAIVNPLGAVPIFVALTSGAQSLERHQIARLVVLAVLGILFGALFLGDFLLAFFGITIHSFSVGGGILLLLMAVSMLEARVSPVSHTAEEAGEGGELQLSTAFRPGIRLTIAASGERVTLPLEVRVRDTGPGIADDMRPHIFEPFVTTKIGGKGLGLALVAKIVHDHGGIIECEPNERGTTFRVLLPTVKEAPEPRTGHLEGAK